MKKLVLFLIIILPVLAYSQETKKSNPKVELPDFVTTGKEIVSAQKAKKIPPDFVSIISRKFTKPAHSPEELSLKEFPNPLQTRLSLIDSVSYKNGLLEAGIGSYFIPDAKLTYSNPFDNGLFEIRLGTLTQRAYVPNSEKLELNGGASLYYFIKSSSPVFDGMKFKLNGDALSEAYKLYGIGEFTPTPPEKRTLNTGNFSFLITNLSNESFLYGIELSDEIAFLNKQTFSENLLGLNGFWKVNISAFNIGLDLNYKRQFIRNDVQNNSEYYFINARPSIGLNLSDVLRLQFGLTYAQDGGHSFSAPYASAALLFNKNLTLFGEFAPAAEFLTENYFIRMNPYLSTGSITNIFFKKTNILKAVLKYEYEEYFEIDGGIKYYTSDEIPVFAYNIIDGSFNVVPIGGSSTAGFINLLFHPGPFGVFYGTLQFEEAKDNAGNTLPYHPAGTASLNYSYNFGIGLTTEASLYYASDFRGAKTYADSISTEQINSYINLGLKFSYRLTPGFFITAQMNNLLNNKNYTWLRYQELPLNIIGGIKLIW